MFDSCNGVTSLGSSVCLMSSMSVASLSFGLLSVFYNKDASNNENCPVLNNSSRNLIKVGLLGVGVSSLVNVSRQLIK
jgi:hypothetical protein